MARGPSDPERLPVRAGLLPSEYDEPVAARRREGWRRYLRHELKTKPELGS